MRSFSKFLSMYDIRFRKKVLEIREKEGLSIRAVAERFGISFRSIVNWLKNLEPKLKRKPYKTKIRPLSKLEF